MFSARRISDFNLRSIAHDRFCTFSLRGFIYIKNINECICDMLKVDSVHVLKIFDTDKLNFPKPMFK